MEELKLPLVDSRAERNKGSLESSSESSLILDTSALPRPDIDRGKLQNTVDTLCKELSELIPPPNPLLNRPVPSDESLKQTFRFSAALAAYLAGEP